MARMGGGLGARLLWELLPSLLPTALGYSLPFGWLAAVSFVLGRWVNDHEVTSLRTAGLHVRVLVLPVAAASALLGTLGMGLAAWVVPAAQQNVREGTRDHLEQFLTSLTGADRSVLLGAARLSFERYADGAFHGVELDRRQPRTGRLETKVLAERLALSQFHQDGSGSGLTLDLSQGYLIQAGPTGQAEVVGASGQELKLAQVEQLGGSTQFNAFFGVARYLARSRDMEVPPLLYALARGGIWRAPAQEAEVALHGRLALGCAPLVMGLFALAVALLLPPTGRRVRDFVLAFVPATLIYFPLLLASRGLAQALPTPVWVAMWLPVLVLGAVSLTLLAWAYRR
jgi:lipopolysaccharide export LptBFGC system permease protein LptF